MKVLLLTTVLLLLCSTQVLALRCYTCDNTNDPDCKTETECPESAQYCKTVERAGDIQSRTCEEFCAESEFINCCDEDLC
ncbi:hypothetical protein D9C73_015416 [Collichthys lucidus]|uniref:Snake toxin/toxin-like domain-containing protein n=1 Tax=Collichthys lucidus TaxID=240159 RepID=A0A4U5V2C7_COLLU|nr:hypothetical protein D9C73_015416 [Collichthys lucidus]